MRINNSVLDETPYAVGKIGLHLAAPLAKARLDVGPRDRRATEIGLKHGVALERVGFRPPVEFCRHERRRSTVGEHYQRQFFRLSVRRQRQHAWNLEAVPGLILVGLPLSNG